MCVYIYIYMYIYIYIYGGRRTFTPALLTGCLGVGDRSTAAGFARPPTGMRTRSGLSEDMLIEASQSEISCRVRKMSERVSFCLYQGLAVVSRFRRRCVQG